MAHARSLCLFGALLLPIGCPTKTPGHPQLAPSPQTLASWRFESSTIDRRVDPCDDFYEHVCGGWAAQVSIEADKTRAEWASDQVFRANQDSLTDILASENTRIGADVERLRAFYGSCIEAESGVDASARQTLDAWLARIEAVDDQATFEATLLELHKHGIHAFFRYSGELDRQDPDRHRGQLHQGTVGIWRHRQDAERLAAYRDHIAAMFSLAGVETTRAGGQAQQVVDLEATLAEASLSWGAVFDPEQSEHPHTVDVVRSTWPALDWERYLAEVGHPSDRSLNVTSPAYLGEVAEILSQTDVGTLRSFLLWRLLHSLGEALPGSLGELHKAFGLAPGVTRAGAHEVCSIATLKSLGVELSREFSTETLGDPGRLEALEVATRVQDVIARSVATQDWLAESAREATSHKAAQTDLKIGFPTDWPSTSTFTPNRAAYLDNVLAARAFEQQRAWQRAQQPRLRTSWEMTVYPNVAPGMAAARLTLDNAFPDVFSNSMIVMAGNLRPPLFDPHAPPEVQYATFGMLVGHEFVHVLEFYDYDAQGVQRDLWATEDIEAHRRRRTCVAEQVDAYLLEAGAPAVGPQMLDESVADVSGVAYAHRAMVGALGDARGEAAAEGGTREQRFFYAYAQRWCEVMRPEAARQSLLTDPHPPARFRVNAPLANLPAFSEAFSCPADAPMVRETQCSVW